MATSRRRLLQTVSATSIVGLAGCSFITEDNTEPDQETIDNGPTYTVPDSLPLRRPAVSDGQENNVLKVYHSIRSSESNNFIRRDGFELFETPPNRRFSNVRIEFYDYPQTTDGRSIHSIARHIQYKKDISEYLDFLILGAVADNRPDTEWAIRTAREENGIREGELREIITENVYQRAVQDDYNSIDSTNPPYVVLNGHSVDPFDEDLFSRLEEL